MISEDFRFRPAQVAIPVGETVAWRNTGAFPHNVKFDDGSFEEPSSPSSTSWTVRRTFNTAGTFAYYCEQHGGPGGSGMAGTVTVQGGPGAPPDTTAPDITALRARQARGRRLSISFTTSEGGQATLRVLRRLRSGRLKTVRKLNRQVDAGTTRQRISRDSRGRRLPRGRYVVRLKIRDAAGNTSATKRTTTRLR